MATESLFSTEQVSHHAYKDDAWIIINKKIYNITPYVASHPGGDAILRFAGKDGTAAVQQQSAHKRVSNFINQTLEKYYITDLTDCIQMSCFHRYTRHEEPKEPTIVCVGASGVGKTLLLEKLKESKTSEHQFIPTIPTSGTNLYNVKLDTRKRKHSVIVRELGGAMAPLWHRYLGDANALIFVVDSSNSFQVSASTLLLLDVLDHSSLDNCPLLLAFNKCDVKPTLMGVPLVRDVMQVAAIFERAGAQHKMSVLETSALTEHGLPSVREWMEANT